MKKKKTKPINSLALHHGGQYGLSVNNLMPKLDISKDSQQYVLQHAEHDTNTRINHHPTIKNIFKKIINNRLILKFFFYMMNQFP